TLLHSSFLLYLAPPPPLSTLFPYTTLFRSSSRASCAIAKGNDGSCVGAPRRRSTSWCARPASKNARCKSIGGACSPSRSRAAPRSEEHTSELQSLRHLVCRLLLEKKNKTTQ